MPKKRVFRAPLIGDPGVLLPRPKTPVCPEIDLEHLNSQELVALALRIGINPVEICGVEHCRSHSDMLPVQRPPTAAYQYGVDILYCKACYTWFRERRPLSLD